ncbi:hypothetical protein LCGC14_2613560 [marine sediment metagenome]|uniref:Uncharacterized protein n=1 Tax=marine sediment metagenome TaxID=412755 RepID=A0A0F9A591_9ZZZZ
MVIETYGHPSAMHGFDLDSTEVDLGKILGSSSEADMIITVSSEVSDIAGKLPTSNLAGSTEIDDLNNISTTDILTQVDIALIARDLDHLVNVDKAGIAPTSGSLFDLIMSKSTDQTFSQATDSLEAIRDRGDAEWITNTLTSTDIITQVNLSTGVSGNFALVAGLKDISTTDVLTQVNLSTGVAGNFALVAGLNDNSATDILTQSAAALVAIDLDHLINVNFLGVDPTSGSLIDLIMNKSSDQTFSQANDSLEGIRDRGDAAWVTNVLTSTDIITQVDLSTGVAGNFALVAGLKDVSTTDILTQVNLSDASTFDPSVDKVNATLTYKKAMDDLTAESYGQVFKTSNAYQYLSSTGGVLFTLTVTSSDRTRTS